MGSTEVVYKYKPGELRAQAIHVENALPEVVLLAPQAQIAHLLALQTQGEVPFQMLGEAPRSAVHREVGVCHRSEQAAGKGVGEASFAASFAVEAAVEVATGAEEAFGVQSTHYSVYLIFEA